jgi:hypothetical protein
MIIIIGDCMDAAANEQSSMNIDDIVVDDAWVILNPARLKRKNAF